jgi:exopolyphosphatase/guanosine-5'-triphosphate,3'-diphosphate pyrophosphatase
MSKRSNKIFVDCKEVLELLGAIDVGTNSVRLLIAKVENNKLVYAYKGLKTTRLGEGSSSNGLLQENAINRTIHALVEFLRVAKGFQVDRIRSVATSAARKALNKDVLLKKALSIGLKLEIISGEEEAWLSFKGATSTNQEIPYPLIIDIGGGSTEIIYSLEGEIITSSTQVGAVSCTEKKWSQAQIAEAILPALETIQPLPEKNLIGVGGTITTLAAIAQQLQIYQPALIQGYKLDFDTIKSIRQQLASLSIEQRRLVPGLQPERADIILAGIDILLSIMANLSKRYIYVSERGILDGIILEMASEPIG